MVYNFFQFFDPLFAQYITQSDISFDSMQKFLHLQVLKNTRVALTHTFLLSEQTVYVLVQQGSSVQILIHDHEQIQQVKNKVVYHILLEQNAICTINLALLFAVSIEIEVHLYVQGDHAQADIFGVYGLSEQQKLSIKTFQIHQGSHTNSSVILKGMLKGYAQVTIEGLIHIGTHAVKTVALQENKNIICDKNAQVKTVPSIEVLQHDVQCCHGAAIGQFDQRHLWSLQSKGLSDHQAYKLLIQSFFDEIAQKLKNSENFMEIVCKKMI